MFGLTLGLVTAHPILLTALGLAALGMSWFTGDFTVQRLANLGFANKTTGLLAVVRNISVQAANYTVLGTEGSGTIFTTTGATGTVTFTLPAVAARYTGLVYEFINAVNQTMTVTGSAGQVITFNNAAATSLTASTASEKIGARILAVCDGVAWHLTGVTVGVAYTVA